jgi:DNA-binding MarR family transcriptional regulator
MNGAKNMNLQQAERFFSVIGEMRRYLMHAKPFSGITHSEMTILHMIDMRERKGERASTTWLSERLHLSKSSISQTLNSMEAKGWIRRSIDPSNRRKTSIDTTEEGRRMMQEVYNEVVENIGRVLERMGQENAERFLDLIEMFLAGAKVEFKSQKE